MAVAREVPAESAERRAFARRATPHRWARKPRRCARASGRPPDAVDHREHVAAECGAWRARAESAIRWPAGMRGVAARQVVVAGRVSRSGPTCAAPDCSVASAARVGRAVGADWPAVRLRAGARADDGAFGSDAQHPRRATWMRRVHRVLWRDTDSTRSAAARHGAATPSTGACGRGRERKTSKWRRQQRRDTSTPVGCTVWIRCWSSGVQVSGRLAGAPPPVDRGGPRRGDRAAHRGGALVRLAGPPMRSTTRRLRAAPHSPGGRWLYGKRARRVNKARYHAFNACLAF